MLGYEKDIDESVAVIRAGGIILYPTDTIWGIGCDALNEKSILKIMELKKRPTGKSLIMLLSSQESLPIYSGKVPGGLTEFLSTVTEPTTVVYEKGTNVPEGMLGPDGSIAIRIIADPFCKLLINALGKPLVSTSANLSGEPVPQNFSDISIEIKNGVDYIVQHRQEDFLISKPSSLVKFLDDGRILYLR